MALQLLGRAHAQQRHERQDQQRGPQPVEAVLERPVGLLAGLQQPQRQQRRQPEQRPAIAHRLGGHKARRRLGQLAQARQHPLGVPLHPHPARAACIAGAALTGPGARGRGACLALRELTVAQRVANRAFGYAHLLGGLPDRDPVCQQPLGVRALLDAKPMRAVRPAFAIHHPEHALAP